MVSPGGTLVQETHWADGRGEGIYLREDGSIRTRMCYVNGVAEGEAKEYDEAGWPAPVLCTMRYESVLLILAPPPEDNGEWVLVSSGGETPPPHAVYPRHSFFFFSRDAANAAGVW